MKFSMGKISSLLLAGTLFAGSGSAQLAMKKTLTLAIAKQVAEAAEAEAVKNKFTMAIAIVDDGNNLMYLERIDDTQVASIQLAEQKAHTALSFKRPTKALEDQVAGGRNAMLSLPGIKIEGGIPLALPNGKIIGAIGVSGGNSMQDGMIAKAGADAFAKMVANE